MSGLVPRLLATAALLATATLTLDASAYCRAKACDNRAAYDDVWQSEPDPECVRNANGCLIAGQPLHWPQTCISFGVQRDGSRADGIDYETARSVISDAFTTWLNADCGDGLPSFVMSDTSPLDCGEAEYNQDQGNANVFTFRDDHWPYDDQWDTLALTTITYNTETAEIYDADVEINSAEANFTVTDDPELIVDDLSAIITHEIGHFLGLSHSENNAATMWSHYNPRETQQRTLHPDDIAGICEIYPPGRPIDENSCEPRHGFSRTCGKPLDEGCGVRGPAPRETGAAAAFGLLALVWAVRRRLASR